MFKRLKIVEQIIIVLFFAVLIPIITIGIIISNISQQSVRNELATNAKLMSQFVGESVESYINLSQSQLNQLAFGFNYISGMEEKFKYFNDIETKTKLFKNMDIVENFDPNASYEFSNGMVTLYSPIDINKTLFLKAQVNVNIIDKLLGKENIGDRNIYIFDSDSHQLIASNVIGEVSEIDVLSDLNVNFDIKNTLFGSKKNTPKAYYKLNNPNWFVVVDTTKTITKNTIMKARYRIIISLCAAALFIIVMVSLYTSYLYINIRQLFKGITAISKGNYDKKIHLVKSIFTPYEIVFLAKEFNYMAKKINVSYKDLKEKNKKLKKLNDFRDNLVNATSHEFRTPLTSIIGYTSRLLRNDIVVDEKTKINSLQIIKQQAQRLSRMVEDLLVIPELDSLSLKYNIQETDLADSISQVLEYLKSDDIEFNTEIASDLNYVYADVNRLEQIFMNLVDNAMKYSLDNQPIKIEAKNIDSIPVVKIINKCEKISDEIKEKLFEKFVRADSELTRTTRGTGLGLYIVKGLCEAMQIEMDFESDDEFIITLKFNDYVK